MAVAERLKASWADALFPRGGDPVGRPSSGSITCCLRTHGYELPAAT
jgi:hypothetical protein